MEVGARRGSRGGETAGLSRRQALLAAAGGAVGAAAIPAGAEGGDELLRLGEDWVFGRITSVSPPSRLVMQSTDREGEVSVLLRSGAEVRRTQQARVSDFAVGDEVTVRGSWQGATLAASGLELAFREVESRVTSRVGDELRTSSGSVLIAATTRPVGNGDTMRKPRLDEIAAGDVISTTAWRDPGSGALVAGTISIVATGA